MGGSVLKQGAAKVYVRKERGLWAAPKLYNVSGHVILLKHGWFVISTNPGNKVSQKLRL